VIGEGLPEWEILSERFHSEFDVEEEWVEFSLRYGFAGFHDFFEFTSAAG
jgi:hypothetical protein